MICIRDEAGGHEAIIDWKTVRRLMWISQPIEPEAEPDVSGVFEKVTSG